MKPIPRPRAAPTGAARWQAARWLASLWLGAAGITAAATEHIVLRGSELQAWADASLRPRAGASPQPLWLAPLVNDSATSTEDNAADSRAAADRAGVPLQWLDALFAAQLEASGRYQLLNRAHADLPQLTVRLTRYRPPHRRGDETGNWQRLRSQWSSWVDLDPQPLAVSLQAHWYDPARNDHRTLWLDAAGDSCLRLSHAPASPGDAALRADTDAWRHSAIGQASMASLHRLLAWLDALNRQDHYELEVSAVRGQRVSLIDSQQWLRVGDEMPLYHRDRPEQSIGRLKIASQFGDQVTAWPLTLAAGSVRPGDRVRLQQAASAAIIEPAPTAPGSRCPNTDATDNAAETDPNSHTETQDSLPADELPQS